MILNSEFEFGACFTDALDTFNGTFTKDLLFDAAITIPFRLSPGQMTAIYGKMIEINFFDYPAAFSVPTPMFDQTWVIQMPAERFHIVVRNGNASKTLDWIDAIREPESREAQKLRALFEMMMEMISARPEYRHLPERNGACA